MTDPTPERDRLRSDERPVDDRPVMGDHPDLEPDEEVRYEPPSQSDDMMSRLMMPGIIVLVIAVVVIAYFLWFN